MIPVALAPHSCRLAVIGNGELALRRLRALRVAGASDVLLFADAPIASLAAEAGNFLRHRLPDAADLNALNIVWIVDVAEPAGETLVAAARRSKTLVNFEDRPEFCDFHSVAEIRRGDLLLTVSTNGAAPGLAGSIRRRLEVCFGPDWSGRVAEISRLRAGWRSEGVKMPEAAGRIEAIVKAGCWLNCPATATAAPISPI